MARVTLSCHFEVGVVTLACVGVLIASSPRSPLDKQAGAPEKRLCRGPLIRFCLPNLWSRGGKRLAQRQTDTARPVWEHYLSCIVHRTDRGPSHPGQPHHGPSFIFIAPVLNTLNLLRPKASVKTRRYSLFHTEATVHFWRPK